MNENLKPWFFRCGIGIFLLYLLFRIRYAAGSFLNIPQEISDRTYTTAEEQAALFLLSFVLFLLFSLILSAILVGGVLSGEERTVLFGLTAAVLAVFYIYACLYGYPLLDNHITTAWLMTGRYTSTLVLSILKLFAGLFGKSFSWNGSLAWRMTCGILLACPLVLFSTFVGLRNTIPVLLGAFLPAFCFLTGQYAELPGPQMMLFGLAAALVSAVMLVKFTDPQLLGREAKKKKAKALLHVSVDDKKRAYFAAALAILWILTFLLDRVRSFGEVMKLIFASSVYAYQKNLNVLGDMRIAQAMLVSYTLSLLVKFVLSKVEFEDDFRFSGLINTGYMLLLQVWVMPVLTKFFGKAAEQAQGTLPGDAVNQTAGQLGQSAMGFVQGLAGKSMLLVLAFYTAVAILGLLLMALLIKIPAVRLFIWFLVYFSACTFVWCLVGLYYQKQMNSWMLLAICYGLNWVLNHLISSGKDLRKAINT